MGSGRAGALAAVLVAMVSIQSGASLAKQLFPAVGAAGATTLRLALAALVVCALFRPWRARLTAPQWRTIAVYGASLGAMNLSFYFAIDRIPLGLAVALELTGPLAIAVFASRRRADLLWALLAVVGLLLILPIGDDLASRAVDPLGAAFALAAGAFWAAYILFGQKAGASVPGPTAAALGMVVAALVTLPVGLAHAGASLLAPALLPLGLAVGVLSSALPYSLEMLALRRLPAQSFGVLMSLEPAIAALSGLAFLGEHLASTQWLAIACVIAASLGSALTAPADPAP